LLWVGLHVSDKYTCFKEQNVAVASCTLAAVVRRQGEGSASAGMASVEVNAEAIQGIDAKLLKACNCKVWMQL
jgi:hypothetical protein